MLSKAENETLTRVGPGAPMGDLMRRYWLPALLSEEIPEPDSPPVRVRLLGESLVAFRDSDGRVGLLDEFCPHRCARSGSDATRSPACAAPTTAGSST
jgi:hypothetical protein